MTPQKTSRVFFFSKAKQSPNAAALGGKHVKILTIWLTCCTVPLVKRTLDAYLEDGAPHLVSGYLRRVQALIELFITRLTQLRGLTITMVAYLQHVLRGWWYWTTESQGKWINEGLWWLMTISVGIQVENRSSLTVQKLGSLWHRVFKYSTMSKNRE